MEIGVSLAGYDGFFSYVDLMIWQAETSDEDLRIVLGATKGVMLDLLTVRAQEYEANAYRRLISWSPKALRLHKEE